MDKLNMMSSDVALIKGLAGTKKLLRILLLLFLFLMVLPSRFNYCVDHFAHERLTCFARPELSLFILDKLPKV